MTEETAFLDALRSDPLDDVTRRVYADWLEDHGDERAAFLRAEQDYAATPPERRDDRLLQHQSTLADPDWAFQAGRRWDVWLCAYPLNRKIPVIKMLRELRYLGLAVAKSLSEEEHPLALPAVPLVLALDAKRRLEGLMDAPPYPGWADRPNEPAVRVELRPATRETAFPVVRVAPYTPPAYPETFVRLLSVRPDRMMTVARLVAEFVTARLFDALDACHGPFPLTIAHASSPEEARDGIIARLEGAATAEVLVAPRGSEAGEWFDIWVEGESAHDLSSIRQGLIRLRGRGYYTTDDPFTEPLYRRVQRFYAEELMVRLRAIGTFAMRRSEDQP
jgi:uncharacterized protein (TIGR02996 family)